MFPSTFRTISVQFSSGDIGSHSDVALLETTFMLTFQKRISFLRPCTIISVAMLLLATGCKVGPDYHVSKVEAPAQWASNLAGGETNGLTDIETWWKGFEDNHLNSLVASGVESNLTLRVAQARVREARAQKGVIAGGLWPSVGSSAGYSRNRHGQNGFPPVRGVPLDYNLYNVAFDAAWELDVFGGTRRAVEAANAEIGAAQYSERDILVSLLAE